MRIQSHIQRRRPLYRRAKRKLYSILVKGWGASRWELRRRIRVFLRGRDRGYLLRLIRHQGFALTVAGAILSGGGAHALPLVERFAVESEKGGGFAIEGIDLVDSSGRSVSGAGDVNGDGLADLIVGAPNADPGGILQAGESYVVFGKADGTLVELSTVASGTGGFVVNGSDKSGSKVSADGEGDVTDTHVNWTAKRGIGSKSSALLVDGLIYCVHDQGTATCLDAETGELVWTQRLGGQFSSSPILANGHIYLFDHEGQAVVIRPERRFDQVAANQLDDGCLASPAVTGRALIVRTRTNLYRIEEAHGN